MGAAYLAGLAVGVWKAGSRSRHFGVPIAFPAAVERDRAPSACASTPAVLRAELEAE